MNSDEGPQSEQAYLAALQHERHMYAWCLVQYGGVAPDAAAALASEFYCYEPPDDEYRELVFHDVAWHWAMLRVRGDGYWRGHPELEAPPTEYHLEARRLAEKARS